MEDGDKNGSRLWPFGQPPKDTKGATFFGL